MNKEKRGHPVFSIGVYLLQIGLVLALVFHSYGSKDAEIIVSLLIALYGMTTAQTAMESVVSGMHFLSLMKRLGHSAETDQAMGAEIEEFTQKDTRYTFAHVLFGFVIAMVGVGKLVFVLFVE
jgi:hypothetical protein